MIEAKNSEQRLSMRVHHIALRSRDVARLERFYVSVLGFSVFRRDETRGSVWLDAGGVVLMLERADPGEPEIPARTKELVAFVVDNADAWRARLATAGLALEATTQHTLYFRDPDGRRLGLSAYRFD